MFESHVRHLVHDGFLEFGIIFQHKGVTEEVFVPYAKYLRIWTNKPEAVRAVFKSHGIPEVPELQFIDEFPRVSNSLLDENGNVGWPPVMERLKEAFESLPRR